MTERKHMQRVYLRAVERMKTKNKNVILIENKARNREIGSEKNKLNRKQNTIVEIKPNIYVNIYVFFIYIRAINNKIIEINSNISVITKAYTIIH